MANQKRFMAQKGLDNNNNTITNVTDPVNSQDAATKAYVDSAKTSANTYTDTKVANLVASAPAALDTLNELATALGNDASFATTVTNSLAGKVATTTTVTGTGALSGGGSLSSNQTITHTNSGVTAGTYNNVTVNAYGHVTSGSNSAYLTGNQSISVTGDATGSGTTGIALTLANSGVTAGTYGSGTQVSSITVDAKGRVTSASNSNIAFPVTSVAGKTGAVTLAVADVSGAASTTYVDTAISNLVNGASAAYDTLAEIQNAMATDAELSAAISALTIGNGTQTITAGSYLTGGGSFTANQTSSSSITLAVQASVASNANHIVARDANGNFNAGTITATLNGNASTATYATSAGSATSASSAATAGQVTINYNNDSNSTYQMLWGSGNSVYGTGGIYCNPSSDYLYSGSFSCGNWFRSSGQTGWYNESYAVGIHATEVGNVRTYNNASFISNNVTATGLMSSANGYQTTAYLTNQRNRIWSFANADAYGLSYFQGTSGRGGSDSIGFHFGTASDAGSQFVMQSNGTFIATGELTAYSDAKVKTNVKTIENALDIVTKMRGVTFDRIQDGKASVGVIAQEVKEVLPQVVNYDEQADIHSVAYGNIVGVLIEAIKAQQVQIAELSAEVAKLKK